MYSHQQMQEKLWSFFDSTERSKLEAIRNTVETSGRHPLVILLYSAQDNRFAAQQLANVWTGIEQIRKRNPQWTLSSHDKQRLLDPNIDTCSGMLGELLVYAYLIEAFPNTKPVATQRTKTPDFEVRHYLNMTDTPVYVEVHSKAWSDQMHTRMKQQQKDFHEGKIGGAGPIRTMVTVVTPFAGANPGSQTEDGISKIANIGSKSCQFPSGHAGILWLNFEQQDLHLVLAPEHCQSLYSMGRGDSRSGIIWNALYGEKGLPIYEVYPDRPAQEMRHDGMFADKKISAVAVNFGREIALLENPEAEIPLPQWFREQFFNVKWFKYQSSRIQMPGTKLRNRINNELDECRGLRLVETMPNW